MLDDEIICELSGMHAFVLCSSEEVLKKEKARPGLSVVFARKDTMCEITVKFL